MEISKLSDVQRKTSEGIDLINSLAWEQGNTNPGQLKTLADETIKNSKAINYRQGRAQGLRNLSYWNFVYGNNTKVAASLAKDGIFYAKNIENKQITAELYDILAMCFDQLGSFDMSLKYTRQSMELFKETGDQRGLAWSMRNLGNLYREAKDIDKAKLNYKEALNLFKAMDHHNGMSRVYNNIGLLYMDQQDYKKALDYQLQSIEIENKINQKGLGFALTMFYIGQIYNHIDSYDKALDSLNIAKKLLEKQFSDNPNKSTNYANVLYEISKAYQHQNKLDSAIDFTKKAIKASEISKNKTQKFMAYKLLSKCYFSQNKFENALLYYKKYALLQEEVLIGENTLKIGNLNMSQEIILSEIEKDTQRMLKEESEKILLRILPKKVMEELRDKGKVKPQQIENATVLFTDFVGFTQISKTMTAELLVSELDLCFSQFDKIITSYGLERMKTIGDGYMAVAGVPMSLKDHAIKSVLAALEINNFISDLKAKKDAKKIPYWNLRIGLNSGPLIAGIIGHSKFAYDVWGETVNIASRMESFGVQSKVNISKSTYELVNGHFDCEPRGEIEVKHRVKFEMYLVKNLKAPIIQMIFK